MKTCPDLEQACEPASYSDLTASRFRDSGQHLQKRAFPGTVAADDANDLPTVDFERNIPKSPDAVAAFLESRSQRGCNELHQALAQ
jgi:hypothetical protein